MQHETEQIFATLEVLLAQNLPFNLPGHENGGDIFPFVWDVSEQGAFNILNLCRANSWLKLTDVDATIKNWQKMNYAKSFPDFCLDSKQITDRTHQIKSLFQVVNTNLHNLESYLLNSRSPYVTHPGVVIGRTEDQEWICISPTVYTETQIPQELISRSCLLKSTSDRPLSEKTLNLLSKIQAITSELGIISLKGDFGGGYFYAYNYQIIYANAATKELALEQALQASGMLEISQFNDFFHNREYLQNWHCNYSTSENYQKYENIKRFLRKTFSQVVMYRLSFWLEENIYIIGQTSYGDWAGIYLNSQFVYNP